MIDAEAIQILKAAVSTAERRDVKGRPVPGGAVGIVAEIENTIVPRRLAFSTESGALALIAGSGRMLRMVTPELDESDEREDQLLQLASVINSFAANGPVQVASSYLDEDIAAEEIGFSATEIAEKLGDAPKELPSEDDAYNGAGLRGFFDSIQKQSLGQAFLLADGQEIELSGEDILPESDEEFGSILNEMSQLKEAVTELCGEEALLLSDGESVSMAFAFSGEGQVLSKLSEVPLDKVAKRWRNSVVKGGS